MKTRNYLLAFVSLTILSGSSFCFAMEEGHTGMKDHATSMSSQQQEDVFLEKKTIDGYMVQFHVMQVEPGMEAQGSHNFMVKVEKDGQIQEDVVVNSKVINPEGEAESKYLMKMGDWYMNGYNLSKKGKYQLLVLFKTSDGMKHKGGVLYESMGK